MPTINFAHLRDRATSGGWINYAVFDARSISGSTEDNRRVLSDLTFRTRGSGLKVDQSALAFQQNGRLKYFGDKNLVKFLSKAGLFKFTHQINI